MLMAIQSTCVDTTFRVSRTKSMVLNITEFERTMSNVVLKKFTPAVETPPLASGVPVDHLESSKPGRWAPILSAYKPPFVEVSPDAVWSVGGTSL